MLFVDSLNEHTRDKHILISFTDEDKFLKSLKSNINLYLILYKLYSRLSIEDITPKHVDV